MKVKIGPHIDWTGPYQIADALLLWPDKYTGEETWRHKLSHRLGEYLANTWVSDFCQWIQDHRERQVYVRIDRYDAWNADHTLSLIALPLLKKLRECKHGAPNVDDEDVPQGLGLRSTEAPAKENSWDTDANHFDRWEWVLDEIIWAHEEEALGDPSQVDCWQHDLADPNWPYPPEGDSIEQMMNRIHYDDDKLRAVTARKQNGFRLFGKYYQALWD